MLKAYNFGLEGAITDKPKRQNLENAKGNEGWI